ncbi:sensor histidine kinase [Hyalangium versicolor]|uniref:sensor histidine kinase n=1 Tax=Hyalangium versicolor TaxID=2861190 RepID=UPI001CCEF953|nr:ATP-binding protein [Hyalangium versicolor]
MSHMRVGDPVRLMRWSRWGILLAAILLSSGMVLSALVNHSRVHEISWSLIRGQGQLLIDGVRQGLRDLGHPPTEESKARLFSSLQDQGLRYIALIEPGIRTEMGTALGGVARAEFVPSGAEQEIGLTEVGSRIRLQLRVPRPRPAGQPPPAAEPPPPEAEPPPPEAEPPPPEDEPPPREDGRPPPPRPGVFQRGPPRGNPQPRAQLPPRPPQGALPPIVLEFEPLMARELVSSSRRSVLISGVVALTMMLAAGIAFRWLKHREAQEHRLARERHLAVLGEMSAVLAHELRNPLASLKGHAQLLAEALPEGRSRIKAERVVKEALRMEDLTTSLLAFVRTGDIHRQQTDPVAIVRAAAEEVDSRRIELDSGTAPDSWSLDAARMQQVLSNLLRNAVQASPEGAQVFARISTEDKALLYEVRDVGTGIPPGQEATIFEPFHTNRPLGNGLGLAVARRVVELHGGSIQASNHPAGGALFRVRIPLSA